MLSNTDYNKVSIDNRKQEILMTFMFALNLYVTSSLTLVYLELISKIQC